VSLEKSNHGECNDHKKALETAASKADLISTVVYF